MHDLDKFDQQLRLHGRSEDEEQEEDEWKEWRKEALSRKKVNKTKD